MPALASSCGSFPRTPLIQHDAGEAASTAADGEEQGQCQQPDLRTIVLETVGTLADQSAIAGGGWDRTVKYRAARWRLRRLHEPGRWLCRRTGRRDGCLWRRGLTGIADGHFCLWLCACW